MLRDIRVQRAVTPTSGWLNVNRECNLRCSWCYAKGTDYRPSDEMSIDLAKSIVEAMQMQGVGNVTLIGGEPTLWRWLFEFNRYCRTRNLRTTLVTNGTRFGVDDFWERYQESPCTNIGLSIKAFDEESFRCVTHSTGFDVTKRGIERVLSIQGSSASVVYSGEDPEELVKIARFASKCGAATLGISPSTPAYVAGRPERKTASVPQRFIDGIVRHYDELNQLFGGRISIAIKLPLCLWPRDFILRVIERSQVTTTCQLQHRSGLLFSHDGSLISCNSLHDYPLGKWGVEFVDGDSLGQHLKTQNVISFYDKVTSFASSKCIKCSVRSYCGGGCPLFYGELNADALIPGWD